MSTAPGAIAVSHHYVPEWYQRRFIEPSAHPHKLQYLDLAPEKVTHPDGSFHYRRALRHLGPMNCFQSDHLYTLNFGGETTAYLEKRFFGKIDNEGAAAVAFFSDYKISDQAHETFQPLLRYIDAQKWRTPKGLDLLQWMSDRRGHQHALRLLGEYFQMH